MTKMRILGIFSNLEKLIKNYSEDEISWTNRACLVLVILIQLVA